MKLFLESITGKFLEMIIYLIFYGALFCFFDKVIKANFHHIHAYQRTAIIIFAFMVRKFDALISTIKERL